MIIVMERTLDYLIELSKEVVDPDLEDKIFQLWENVGPDNMKLTKNNIKYVKVEK